MQLELWERQFEAKLNEQGFASAGHDLLHIKRVVANARKLAKAENADVNVVVPAAWLHDFVTLEKNDPNRCRASSLAAEQATQFLRELGYPDQLVTHIADCIRAHSWSAELTAESIEAKVVQDADRLDALGAIGIARCFSGADRLTQVFYNETDPFPQGRALDERRYTLDHFYVKLLRIPQKMQTNTGTIEAERRGQFLKQFVGQLRSELEFA